MKKNTSNLDRGVRLAVALIAAYLGYAQTSGTVSLILYVVAAIMALVAATGFCPLYRLFGFTTKK